MFLTEPQIYNVPGSCDVSNLLLETDGNPEDLFQKPETRDHKKQDERNHVSIVKLRAVTDQQSEPRVLIGQENEKELIGGFKVMRKLFRGKSEDINDLECSNNAVVDEPIEHVHVRFFVPLTCVRYQFRPIFLIWETFSQPTFNAFNLQ